VLINSYLFVFLPSALAGLAVCEASFGLSLYAAALRRDLAVGLSHRREMSR
jgi:hypothetical protein